MLGTFAALGLVLERAVADADDARCSGACAVRCGS